MALLCPMVFGVVAASNVFFARRDAQRASDNQDIFTSVAYIAFATALIATVGRCIVRPMRSQLRGYILRPLLVAFVSMTATQGVAAVGSSFLLPLFAEATRFQRVVIRLVLFPLISELVLTAVRLVCRIAFTPSLASQYTIMWLTPPLLATSLLGRLLATNLTSLGEAIALAVMIALVERGMRFTMPHRDFAAERCLQACDWGQARGRARDALPEEAAATASTPLHDAGTPNPSTASRSAPGNASDSFSPQDAVQLGLPAPFAAAETDAPGTTDGTRSQLQEHSSTADPSTSVRGARLAPYASPLVSHGSVTVGDTLPAERGESTGSAASGGSLAAQNSNPHALPPHHPQLPAAMSGSMGDGRPEALPLAPGARDGTASGDPNARATSLRSVPSWTQGILAEPGQYAHGTPRSDVDELEVSGGSHSPKRQGSAPGMPPLHPPTSSASSSRGLLVQRDSASPMRSESPVTVHATGAPPGVRIRANPPRSGDAQVTVQRSGQDNSPPSSMPLWRVWHSRRWNHFQNAYLEVDTLSEDVGIMVSLPLALLFRLPPEPGAAPLSAGAVVLRVVLQLVVELLTELAPVFVVLITRACSRVEALPLSASHLAREVLKLPGLRNAEIISTPTGIQLRLQDTPRSKPAKRSRGGRGAAAAGKGRSTPVAAAAAAGGTSAGPLPAGAPHASASASPTAVSRTGTSASRAKQAGKVRPVLEPLAMAMHAASAGEVQTAALEQGDGTTASAAAETAAASGVGSASGFGGTGSTSYAALHTVPEQASAGAMPVLFAGAAAPPGSSPATSGSGGPISPGAPSRGDTGSSPLSPGSARTTAHSELSAMSTPHNLLSPDKPKRMLFGFGSKVQKPSQLDKSFSPAAAAAWYLNSPHPNRRRSSAGSASTAFSAFGPANCCERTCPRLAFAFEDLNCACTSARRCIARCRCRYLCACKCLPPHLRRVLCHGPECSSLEAHKGERCCGSAVPRSTSGCLCAALKGPMCMFVSRSWRLFLGCCLNDWDRGVLRESSIALRRIWAEDMAVERASLWQPFELTAVMRAVYDPQRRRERHDALRQGARNLLDDTSGAHAGDSSRGAGQRQQTVLSPVEDARACCCTQMCVAKNAVRGSKLASPRLARVSGAFHWLGTVAEARTVKRLQAWELLPPGFRVLFVLMAASVVMVIVWQTMNVQLRCAYTLSPDVSLQETPDAPLKFDFCS